MSHKKKEDMEFDAEIKRLFDCFYTSLEKIKIEDVPEIPMKTWEEIEALADEMERSIEVKEGIVL